MNISRQLQFLKFSLTIMSPKEWMLPPFSLKRCFKAAAAAFRIIAPHPSSVNFGFFNAYLFPIG